ncbi:LCP family protein [Streptacidiphilus monticola]|uniref:LCP family protein n=1 Tax=Streptacidiphilus monticola TaxID=2161674 RepID=A0ABW1G8W1_9ACTN
MGSKQTNPAERSEGSRQPSGSGHRRERSRKRRMAVIAAWSVGCLLLICGAAGGAVLWKLNHNIKSVDIDKALGSDRPAASTKGAENILVLGSDSRSGAANQALGGGSTGDTARSDTAMIVHVNQDHSRATVVSIPRDTLVSRPECTTGSGTTVAAATSVMFNTAYETGGATCAVKTVEAMTGLRMDHYIEVDFSGFAKLIDALGGVDVTTTIDIHDSKSHLDLPKGTHHLDGRTALAFVRTRHGIGDGSDLGRIQLQQQMVKAVATKVASLDLFGDPTRLYSIADAATSAVTTDSNLGSVTSLVSFGESLRKIKTADITTVTLPNETAPADVNRVVPKEPEATDLWTALQNDQAVPDSVLKLQIRNPADS